MTSYLTTTPRGRRSPALAWRVTTAAGDTWQLSGLQRAALLYLSTSARHGRHTATVTELGLALGCGRGSASKILRRLRSLSLIGAPRPNRGRRGGFTFWMPRPGSVRADAARRRQRWPTFANDSTPTPFGGYLTREGMRRAWRAAGGDRSGDPPAAAGPRRGPLAGPRARGRPWPPRYVDLACPLDGGRIRLVRSGSRVAASGDLAAAYAAPCPRCRRPVAVSVVLVRPDSGPVLAGTVAGGIIGPPAVDAAADSPPSRRSQLAAAAVAVIPELTNAGQVDRLRIDHLGYRRRPVVIPPIRPPITGEDPTPAAWAEALADLATVTMSRTLEAPT